MDIKKSINHIWVFLTDLCNLHCKYCFYKYRSQRHVMGMSIFRNLLNYIRLVDPAEFIFSGGEPLLAPDRLMEMIEIIKQSKSSRYISVQTNATLLNQTLTMFFLQYGVNLEIGIDGHQGTTVLNRTGTVDVYQAVLNGVELAVRSGGAITTTMVVHPFGVSKLQENLKYLASIGLRSIEVHPAFLEDWDEASSTVFLEKYRQASAWELKTGRKGLIGRGYSEPACGAWDLLTLPNGKVLPNWLLLSFPEEVRQYFYLIDFEKNSEEKFLPQAEDYFCALMKYLENNPGCSYRSISNFNAVCASKTPGGSRYEKKIRAYINLCQNIQDIDRKILIKNNSLRSLSQGYRLKRQ